MRTGVRTSPQLDERWYSTPNLFLKIGSRLLRLPRQTRLKYVMGLSSWHACQPITLLLAAQGAPSQNDFMRARLGILGVVWLRFVPLHVKSLPPIMARPIPPVHSGR